MIDESLARILACPICDERPALKQDGNTLVCALRGHRFPIVDGLPHLVREEALEPDSTERLTDGR